MLSHDCKDIDSLNAFKNKVKKWKSEKDPFQLCKSYIDTTGFV